MSCTWAFSTRRPNGPPWPVSGAAPTFVLRELLDRALRGVGAGSSRRSPKDSRRCWQARHAEQEAHFRIRASPEFEAALDLFVHDRDFGDQLGQNGRRYVESTYNWPMVIDGVERSVELAQRRFASRA